MKLSFDRKWSFIQICSCCCSMVVVSLGNSETMITGPTNNHLKSPPCHVATVAPPPREVADHFLERDMRKKTK
ncbi:hypothetical protein Hanom_Chr09g00865661 [Helianthus anomalus]